MRKLPTLLDDELKLIFDKSTLYTFPNIDITMSTSKDDYRILLFNRLEIKRNFNKDIADILYIDFLFPLGTFIHEIYKNKEAIEVVINYEKYGKNITKQYKAVVMNKIPLQNDSKIANSSIKELDTQEMVTISLQLLDPLTLALKNSYISSIYHNVKLDRLLKALLARELSEMKVLGKLLDYRLNIYKIDNEDIYKNIHIKPFSKLIKLPHDFQNNDYGLYNNDIGIYYSNINSNDKSIQYDIDIFPLTDYSRYDKEIKQPKLLLINPTIANIDKNNYNAYLDVDTYKLIVSNVKFQDTDEKRYNNGTGIIEEYDDLTTNKDLIYVDDEKVIYDNNNSFNYEEVDTELIDYNKYIKTNQDGNIYKYNALINRNLGIRAVFTIPNIDNEFIIPGMATKYMFVRDDKIVTTTGIVEAMDYVIDNNKKITMLILIVILKRLRRDDG